MQVFFTSGITDAANEHGILSGSPDGGYKILFSYRRVCCGCDTRKIFQVKKLSFDIIYIPVGIAMHSQIR